jgi:RHS repeat-associated protein
MRYTSCTAITPAFAGAGLGSASLTTNNTGGEVARQSYYPYGSIRAVSGVMPTKIAFTGQYTDDTGLMFFQARYLSPVLGRFVSADTIVPGAGNPQAFNRYSYGLNNPVKYTDPTGHMPCYFCEGGGGGSPVGYGGPLGYTDGSVAGNLAGAEAVVSGIEFQVLFLRTFLLASATTAAVRLQTSKERSTTREYDTIGDPGEGPQPGFHNRLTTSQVRDIGVTQGQLQALSDELIPTGWQNPIGRGRPDQPGFDDIMEAPNGDMVIVEYKGGTAKLSPGQMERGWVTANIQRLIRAGDPMGVVLRTALNEGRLSGVVYSTPILNGYPQPTKSQWFWYAP